MYVERKDGAIVGAYRQKQPGYAEEELADDDTDLVAFLAPKQGTRAQAVQARVSSDSVFSALLDEVAELRGVTRDQMLARLAGKLS